MNAEPEAATLPLFDATNAEPPQVRLRDRMRKIEWSYSKRNELEQCPKKYYFDYYGASARRAKTEPQKQHLRTLKKLHNRHERAGQILHLVIARYFRSAASAAPLDENGMIRWAEKLFSNDIEHSRAAGRELAPTIGEYPPVQLLEFFHGAADAADLCELAREKLITALQTFADSRKLAPMRCIRGHSSIRIEKKFKLPAMVCRVAGVVDFAAHTQADPGIVDWKIGAASAAENDSLQLAVYALWGAQEFGRAPETIRIFKAYLGSDELLQFCCTTESLDKSRRRIGQDARRMLEMVDYGDSGRVEAFTACAQPRVCSLCRYLTACEEGMEAIRG